MAQNKRNEAKHPQKPKCQLNRCVKPNPLRHSPMAKQPEKCQVKPCQDNLEDELIMHLIDIKNAYSKKPASTKIRPKCECNNQNQDIFNSKVYNVVSAALECGCVHDVLQKQGNFYCLRNRCVMHSNPGAPRYCQDCCKMHRILKEPPPNEFQGTRSYGQQPACHNGPKMQVVQCPECRALERTRK